jgi:phytoene desaturase
MSIQQSQHAVVIGAGFGGLAAAVRLRARGYRVTVVEANEQAGGRASVTRKDGHIFDGGPTVITAPYLIDELFTLLGQDSRDHVEMLPVDPFYRVDFHDGSRFDYVGEEDRILAQIQTLSPKDVDGYRRLAAHAERVFDVGYTGLVDKPFERFGDMMRIAPDIMRLGSYRTIYGLVSQYIKDERLRQAFTFQPLLIGGSPFRAPGLYLLIHWLERKWGVWFPKGGTGALVQALVDLLASVDVEVRLNSPVEKIDVNSSGKVTGVRVNGQTIAADVVVANGDPSTIYRNLIDEKMRPDHSDRKLDRVAPSMSLFVSYFGTDKKFDDVAHHTIVLGPRYKGLLDDIFVRNHLADDFSMYLHRPTASDPDLAPPGKESFYVLSPVPNLKAGVDWAEAGPRYEEAMLTELERRGLTGLKASITTKVNIDPRTFRDRYRSAHGAAFGPEPLLTQSAYFRFHNRSEDVDGLFFVGAGTHPGAGVPGVLCSAKVLDRVLADPASPVPLPTPARRQGKAA